MLLDKACDWTSSTLLRVPSEESPIEVSHLNPGVSTLYDICQF